jgi:hypothetical protein
MMLDDETETLGISIDVMRTPPGIFDGERTVRCLACGNLAFVVRVVLAAKVGDEQLGYLCRCQLWDGEEPADIRARFLELLRSADSEAERDEA